MDLGNYRQSKNFQDVSPYTRTDMGQNLVQSLLLQGMQHAGAPGGYNNWLMGALNHMSPQDYYIMKNSRIPLEILNRYKLMQQGRFPIAYEAYPYKDQISKP